MDLSSSGTKTILVLTFCVISFGQVLIEENVDSPYLYVNHEEGDGDTHVSGDVYILDRLNTDNKQAVKELLQNIIETDNKVFVKIAGHGISIVTDFDELSDVLKYRDDQRKNNIFDDVLDVLQVIEKKVHIYIITEDDSSVAEGTENQLSVFKERDIRIDILRLHGQIYNYGIRHKRQINFYQLLANVSGGSVIQTNKQNIGSALNLLKQSIKTSLVHVMRFYDHSPPGKQFHVPVDNTMTQLIFRAQVERSNPVIIAMTPLGIPSSSHPQLLGKASAGTVVGLLEVNLTKADYGTWKISKLDANLWDIKVDGQSSVDFTHEFLEPGASGFGEFPIKGRPIVGKTYKLSITVPEYAKVKTVAMGMLFSLRQLMPIDMRPLTNVGGRRGKSMFYAQFKIPKENFMVGIEGRDTSGHMFRRIDPILITPISLKLVIPSLIGVKFYQNETLTIPFTVVNEGSKEQDVDVKIEDDKHFALAPNILSATIKPGQNFTGQFVIRAGLTVGETTTVTVTAKPYLGPGLFSQGQFEIRRFTVSDKNLTTTTITTPTTSTTSTTSTSTTSTLTTSTPTTSTPSIPSTTVSSTTTSSTSATMASTSSAKSTKFATSTAQLPTSLQSSMVSKARPTSKAGPTSSSATAATSSIKGLKTPASTVQKTGSSYTVTSTASATLPVKHATTATKMTSSVQSTTISKSVASTTTTKAAKGPVTNKIATLPPTTTVTTATPTLKTTTKSNGDKESDNTDLPTTSIVVGISTGAVVGVAAIGTMALLFRRAMKKSGKSVEPSREELYNRRRQSSLAWT